MIIKGPRTNGLNEAVIFVHACPCLPLATRTEQPHTRVPAYIDMKAVMKQPHALQICDGAKYNFESSHP